MLNTTWKVPSLPSDMNPRDSSAPGWWFGIQTAAGDGALIQPILAWGYKGAYYSMFNGVFDWTDVSWRTSPEVFTVQPGDTLVRCAAPTRRRGNGQGDLEGDGGALRVRAAR